MSGKNSIATIMVCMAQPNNLHNDRIPHALAKCDVQSSSNFQQVYREPLYVIRFGMGLFLRSFFGHKPICFSNDRTKLS